MNEKKHWERIAQAIMMKFLMYMPATKRKASRYFKKHGSKNNTAIDFGCGNGKSFPYLAPIFKHVLGLDISKGLLKQAKQRGYSNVALKKADLTKKRLTLTQVDFAFCCNVIMFPDLEKNYTMLANINKALKPGGAALVVLPSLDSALFSSWRLIDLYRKEGVDVNDIPAHEFHYFKGTKRDLIQGIVHIDGVPTKHYSQTELQVTFEEAGFKITALERLEYD
ncbi:MAG: class I SAM-dependent methyltransferase [Cytophagales bacterium]|nr:class I SAM-dependent methyltransferase [Cytophagales bacterium]